MMMYLGITGWCKAVSTRVRKKGSYTGKDSKQYKVVHNYVGHCFIAKSQKAQQVGKQVRLVNHTGYLRTGCLESRYPQSHPSKGRKRGNLTAWHPSVSRVYIHQNLFHIQSKLSRFCLTSSSPSSSYSRNQIPGSEAGVLSEYRHGRRR